MGPMGLMRLMGNASGGTSTERLKSGAGKSWGENHPGRAEIFAPPF